MISTNGAFGSSDALLVRDSSSSYGMAPDSLHTVDHLLNAIALKQPNQSISMLRTTADHFAEYVGVPSSQLTIEFMERALPGFKRYLSGRKLAPNSVKSYRDFAVSLLRRAGELGWVRASSQARTAWDPLPEQLNGVAPDYEKPTF
jgi:hypothetical protein